MNYNKDMMIEFFRVNKAEGSDEEAFELLDTFLFEDLKG
jgi:hypothetical protein